LPVQIPSETTLAASTMATDGERLFAIFGTSDLIALNFEGKVIWSKNLGPLDNPYGHGSSLTVADDLVLVQLDQRKTGAFFGIDARTGSIRWKTDRKFQPAWSTPAVAELSGKKQAVLTAAPAVAGYDLKTGAELWRVDCFAEAEVAPSAVAVNGKLLVAAENLGMFLIDPEKRGVVWKETDDTPGVVTSVVSGDLMFYGMNDGGIVCRKVSDGKKVWSVETDDGFYASPLLSGERVFLMDRAGTMKIFAATNEFKLIAQPKLGEPVNATPAAHGNSLFVRGKQHVFRIGL
jgi:outer membrane protein assembly factor BamB